VQWISTSSASAVSGSAAKAASAWWSRKAQRRYCRNDGISDMLGQRLNLLRPAPTRRAQVETCDPPVLISRESSGAGSTTTRSSNNNCHFLGRHRAVVAAVPRLAA
jgi:hypothetical protein